MTSAYKAEKYLRDGTKVMERRFKDLLDAVEYVASEMEGDFSTDVTNFGDSVMIRVWSENDILSWMTWFIGPDWLS